MDALRLPSLSVPTVRLPGQTRQPDKEPLSYIKDGLVFHLDGIDKGPNPDAWTDLVGGVVFENNGAVALDNGWRFDNTSTSLLSCLKAGSTINFPFTTHTIEVVFRNYLETPKASLLFIASNINSLAAGYSKAINGLSFTLDKNNKINFPAPFFPLYDITYIAGAYETCVYNDLTKISNNGSDYWSLGTNKDSTIGGRNSSSPVPFMGIIHSIRIYNRLLSTEEMFHNQKVDRNRFSGDPLPAMHDYATSVIGKLDSVDTPKIVTFGSDIYNTLSDEEIALATSKGWTIVSA